MFYLQRGSHEIQTKSKIGKSNGNTRSFQVEIEIVEPKFDKDFYRYRAKEALAVYLRGNTQRKAYADIIAGICELAYQKGLRDGRQKS